MRKNLISEYTFDTDIGSWFEKSTYYPYSANISSYTARQGKSLKLELRKGENNRSELGTDPRLAPKEGWYGFSLFFPSSFTNESNIESIVQFQSFPDNGKPWRSAPFFIGVLNDKFILDQRTEGLYLRTELGLVGKSKWNDFVIHAKWSNGSDGLIEIWHNDKLILSKGGANCYNDKLNPYFKIGIYKWDNTTVNRTIYIDEVRIGNEKATYNDVYPYKKLIKTVKYYSDGSTEEK